MSASKESLCITCGLPSGDPPRLNHLPNGRVCGACRDRLLEYLPPALPAAARAAGELGAEEDACEPAWSEGAAQDEREEQPVERTSPRGEDQEAPATPRRPELRALPPRRPGA